MTDIKQQFIGYLSKTDALGIASTVETIRHCMREDKKNFGLYCLQENVALAIGRLRFGRDFDELIKKHN